MRARGGVGKLESCVDERPEPRSPVGMGFDLASRAITIGLEFALPAAGGYGLDAWLGTLPAATVLGVILGFVVGMMHAVRMSRELSGGPSRPPGPATPRGRSDRPK